MNVKTQVECRICGGELEEVLDLGTIYHSSFVNEDYVPDESEKAPLVLSKCKSCGLVQLRDTVDLDVMYKDQYWYSSSLNKSMVSSLKDVVNEVESKVNLKDGDTILDIGANDCTLLNLYTNNNLYRIGYDPAPNLKREPNVVFINDYFSSENYITVFGDRKVKVITAIAMFYDLPDPSKFVNDLKNTLAEDGLIIIQFTDLLSMFKVCAFDNICHEHLEYYRLSDVVKLLRFFGLDVIDVSYNDVNGGSVRITACHEGAYLPKPSVVASISAEREYFNTHSMEDFSKCIEDTKFKIREFLKWAKLNKHEMFIMGASTKGNTFLQICNITDKDTPYAADVNKEKFGLVTLGSNIKIISEEDALIKHPGYFIVAIWHFKKSLLNSPKVKDYLKSGGKLVFPLPYFHIVFMDEYSDEPKEVRV